MAERTSSRALIEIIVAIVLVVAFASIFLSLLGWLASALWWLFKVAVVVVVIFLVVRLLLSRHRS